VSFIWLLPSSWNGNVTQCESLEKSEVNKYEKVMMKNELNIQQENSGREGKRETTNKHLFQLVVVLSIIFKLLNDLMLLWASWLVATWRCVWEERLETSKTKFDQSSTQTISISDDKKQINISFCGIT